MKNSIKELEVYKGDDIKKQESSELYEIISKLPKPDVKMKLTTSQKYWWYWIGNELVKTDQVSKLDLIHLQDAAVAMDMKCKLVKIINEKNRKSESGVGGIVQKFVSGATNITGYQSALKDQIKLLDDISAKFGLSIKDREKLKGKTVDPGQLDLFSEFMKQKTS